MVVWLRVCLQPIFALEEVMLLVALCGKEKRTRKWMKKI